VAIGALLLNGEARGRRMIRTIVLAPTAVTPAVVGTTWYIVFGATIGPLNWLLSLAGMGPVGWLTNPLMPPFTFLLNLAGLQTAPDETLGAAKAPRMPRTLSGVPPSLFPAHRP